VIGQFPWDPFPQGEPEALGPDPLHTALYRGAVTGADAYRSVRLALRLEGSVLRIGNRFVPEGRYREVAFLAAGNAANSMALAALDVLGDRLTQGFLAGPEPPLSRLPFRGVSVGPGWGGADAAAEVVTAAREIAAELRASDLFLLLLSPGAGRGLVLPPAGMTPAEFSGFLERAHARSASGLEVALLARALGTGGAGGRLLPATTAADVETLLVDRGDGPARVGGGPTIRLSADERTEARAVLDRLGVAGELPAPALETLRRADGLEAPLPDTVRRPVVVAGPSDALRGAADSAFDRGWTSRVAFLELADEPVRAADRFLERTETLVAEGGKRPPGERTKGLVAVAMLTLDLPEGVADGVGQRRFVERARDRLRRRQMSVGLYATAGPAGPGEGPGGFVVGAPGDPEVKRPPGEIRPLAMRSGITDVGLVAVAVSAEESPPAK
jgi:hypothetical protein